MPRILECSECERLQPHHAKGLCGACYARSIREHPDTRLRMLAASTRWKQAHPEQMATYARRYKLEHLEQVRFWLTRWRTANKEAQRIHSRRSHAKHPEAVRASRLRRYAANPEKVRARIARWQEAHPEQWKAILHARRARKRGLLATLTAEQWKAIKVAYKECCSYCGKKAELLTQDHVLPLSRGGEHVAANVVPACRSCNSRKSINPPKVAVQTLLL